MLHQTANQEARSDEVYNGMIQIACMSLADLAKRGLFGDHARIGFNVSEVGDDVAIIAERDRRIRAIIGDVI